MSANSRHGSGAPTGTATTTLDGPRARTACTAARIVAPVARPSSTRIATRLRRAANGRPWRYSRSRRCSSTSSRLATASIALAGMAYHWTVSSFSTRTPPEAIAPIANSGWPGIPSLRTTKISSGASSASAISNATGTPPRGSARTITSWRPRYFDSRAASSMPASRRSSNASDLPLAREVGYAIDFLRTHRRRELQRRARAVGAVDDERPVGALRRQLDAHGRGVGNDVRHVLAAVAERHLDILRVRRGACDADERHVARGEGLFAAGVRGAKRHAPPGMLPTEAVELVAPRWLSEIAAGHWLDPRPRCRNLRATHPGSSAPARMRSRFARVDRRPEVMMKEVVLALPTFAFTVVTRA